MLYRSTQTLELSLYAFGAHLLLQPYQDANSGTVDTWPAHASISVPSCNGPLIHLGHNVLVDKIAASRSPKPKFLKQMEVALQKELHCLGVTALEPSDVRLQVS